MIPRTRRIYGHVAFVSAVGAIVSAGWFGLAAPGSPDRTTSVPGDPVRSAPAVAKVSAPSAGAMPTPDPSEGALRSGPRRAADTLRAIPEETVMAVVVQTEGLGSRFAPDHLIHLPEPELTLVLDPQRPSESHFAGEFWVPDLVVDDPGMRREMQTRLQELGLLDRDYADMSSEDREDVRASMLSEGQLHAAEHSMIRVESVEVRPADDDTFPWTGTLAMTVRDVTAQAPFHASLEDDGDGIRIEAFARFLTSDFGIEPYRAFLGAVRNRDEIGLYLHLMAERP